MFNHCKCPIEPHRFHDGPPESYPVGAAGVSIRLAPHQVDDYFDVNKLCGRQTFNLWSNVYHIICTFLTVAITIQYSDIFISLPHIHKLLLLTRNYNSTYVNTFRI